MYIFRRRKLLVISITIMRAEAVSLLPSLQNKDTKYFSVFQIVTK